MILRCFYDGAEVEPQMAAWTTDTDADGFQHGQPYMCAECNRWYSVGTHQDGRTRLTELPPPAPRQEWPPRGSFAEMEERAKKSQP